MFNGSSQIFFCIAAFCSKWKVSYHYLHVWLFGNILYTVRKLSSRELQGCMLYLCILRFTCKNKDHPSFSSVSLHSAGSGRFCIIFCMSDGLATYYIPLERSLQEIFEGACFTCVFKFYLQKQGSSILFFHIAAFGSKQNVSYHFLHVWWIGNILYTVRKLSRELQGCMLYLCI